MPRCPSCHQEFPHECRNDHCPNDMSTFASDAPLLPQGVCVSCSGTTYTPVEDRPEKGFVAGQLVCTNNRCLLAPGQLKRAPVLWMYFCIMGGPFLTRSAVECLCDDLRCSPIADALQCPSDLVPYLFSTVEILTDEARKDERLRFPLASHPDQFQLLYNLCTKRTNEDAARERMLCLWFVSGVLRRSCRVSPRELFAIRTLYGAWCRITRLCSWGGDSLNAERLRHEIGNDPLLLSERLYNELRQESQPCPDDIERLARECLSVFSDQDPHSYARPRMDRLVAWFKAQLDRAEHTGKLPEY